MASVLIPLTQGKFATIDEADVELVSQYRWHACDRGRTFYAATSRDRRSTGEVIYLHRLLAKPNPDQHVDHINGDGLDCRRANLRLCTDAENRRNMRKTRGASRFKGVSVDPRQPGKPWCASIHYENKKVSLGSYETEVEAARAYNAAAVELHGQFANLNVIAGMTYEESILAPARNRRPGRRAASARATT